jgi:DNA/RNA-binding domain of Phe-tRNA-synthetase-like protein
MVNLTFELGGEVVERFPQVAVGAFAVEDLHLASERIGDVSEQARAAREGLAAAGLTLQNVTSDRRVAGWRETIASCGLKPGTYKGSVEQLARRFLKGDGISTPLPVVNLYCAISTRHMAPLGGYDVARLPEPTVVLRMGRPGKDQFRPLGGRAEDMPILPTVPVYASGNEVLCWAFNHRDSGETCLLARTTAAVFFSEAVIPDQRIAMTGVLEELAQALKTRGARTGAIIVCDADSPRASIAL